MTVLGKRCGYRSHFKQHRRRRQTPTISHKATDSVSVLFVIGPVFTKYFKNQGTKTA